MRAACLALAAAIAAACAEPCPPVPAAVRFTEEIELAIWLPEPAAGSCLFATRSAMGIARGKECRGVVYGRTITASCVRTECTVHASTETR